MERSTEIEPLTLDGEIKNLENATGFFDGKRASGLKRQSLLTLALLNVSVSRIFDFVNIIL